MRTMDTNRWSEKRKGNRIRNRPAPPRIPVDAAASDPREKIPALPGHILLLGSARWICAPSCPAIVASRDPADRHGHGAELQIDRVDVTNYIRTSSKRDSCRQTATGAYRALARSARDVDALGAFGGSQEDGSSMRTERARSVAREHIKN